MDKASLEVLLVVLWIAFPFLEAVGVLFWAKRNGRLVRSTFLSFLTFGLVFFPLSFALSQGSLAAVFVNGLHRFEQYTYGEK